LAVGEKLCVILTDPDFDVCVYMVAIDELHLVNQWGSSWREAYGQIHILRGCLGPTVKWFGCSVTLDAKTLLWVQQLYFFMKSRYKNQYKPARCYPDRIATAAANLEFV
jgi:superfamily II DNA helicase RecQ